MHLAQCLGMTVQNGLPRSHLKLIRRNCICTMFACSMICLQFSFVQECIAYQFCLAHLSHRNNPEVFLPVHRLAARTKSAYGTVHVVVRVSEQFAYFTLETHAPNYQVHAQVAHVHSPQTGSFAPSCQPSSSAVKGCLQHYQGLL